MFLDRFYSLLALVSIILFLVSSTNNVSASEPTSNVIDSNDKASFSQSMVDIKPSAQFDYGYITEREMEKIANQSDIDLEMLKKEALDRQKNMNKASNMSLMEINELLGTGSKTFKQSQIPHTHYLGSEVHLHLMHIDYAQVLMNYWDMLKATNVDTNNLPKFGRINHDDVGFYNKKTYQNFCKDNRIGLCMTSFSPALKSVFTLNRYIHGIHKSLEINGYDVNDTYKALMSYKHQLQHIIYNDLLDSSLVGLKEAQDRELRKGQPIVNTSFEGVEVKKKPFTPEQIARIKEAARSSYSVVLQARSEDKIDVMVSLDDLPYGYVDPYEKQVKKFKPEYLNNNVGANKEKAAKEQELKKEHDLSKNQSAEDLKLLAYEKARHRAKFKAQKIAREQKRIPKPISEHDIQKELELLYGPNHDYALVLTDDLPYDTDHYRSEANSKLAIEHFVSQRKQSSESSVQRAPKHQALSMDEIRAKDLGLGYEPHFYHSKANALSHITKNPIFEQGGSTFFKHSVLFRNDKTKCSEIGRLIIGTSELRLN